MWLVSQFNCIYSKSNTGRSKQSRMIAFISLLFVMISVQATDFTDNTCTFKINGKVFSLAFLNKNARSQQNYYSKQYQGDTYIEFNFCQPFIPKQCPSSNLPYAYSYLIKRQMPKDYVQIPQIYQTTDANICIPYSSNSKISNYQVTHLEDEDDEDEGESTVNLTLFTDNIGMRRMTTFLLECNQAKQGLDDIQIKYLDDSIMVIKGQSSFACPIFTIQSLWQALANNKIIFGILLLIIGFIMLFYGVLMIHLMVFLATYFLSFAALLGIFSAFLSPESGKAVIYFSLLFILFLSTLLAYGLAKMVDFSIFFIGAFFGFILAALVNTIFAKLFSVYSIWSLIFFEVLFTIPLGLLTFKYNKQIIILSTSLAGAYMIVRPFSWIFGGFPNEFTLYQSIQEGSANALTGAFFIYLIFILVLFAVGAHYQLLKVARKNNDTEQVNYLPGAMQDQLDIIHQHVQNLINKYSKNQQNENKNEDYTKMDVQMPPSSFGEIRPDSNPDNRPIQSGDIRPNSSGQKRPNSKQRRMIELQPLKRKSKENDF